MRNLMKKSGLTPVITISLAAMAFLSKNAAQWVILITIAFFIASKILICYLDHEDEFLKRKEEMKSKIKMRNKSEMEQESTIEFAVRQLSYRVTDRVHSLFPEGSWHWYDRPTTRVFAEGGVLRIATKNTGEFSEADVIIDTYGRIEVEMLKADRVSQIIKTMDKKADTNYTMDAEMWYSQCAQKVLTDIITDLNACGKKTLSIREDGSLVGDDELQVGKLKSFPSKNLWKRLVSIFEENGLMAVENENCIEIGW